MPVWFNPVRRRKVPSSRRGWRKTGELMGVWNGRNHQMQSGRGATPSSVNEVARRRSGRRRRRGAVRRRWTRTIAKKKRSSPRSSPNKRLRASSPTNIKTGLLVLPHRPRAAPPGKSSPAPSDRLLEEERQTDTRRERVD
jgi:hypothetical protein